VGVSLRDADRVGVSGEVLPFPPTPSASIAGRTMQQSVYRRREPERHLPVGAPNIMIVLIDDAGPALPTTFGGEVHTWTRPDHGRVRGTRRPDPRTTPRVSRRGRSAGHKPARGLRVHGVVTMNSRAASGWYAGQSLPPDHPARGILRPGDRVTGAWGPSCRADPGPSACRLRRRPPQPLPRVQSSPEPGRCSSRPCGHGR
jgi:hypothetical protein